jgi:hypothetical protein
LMFKSFLVEMSIGQTDFPDNCCKFFHDLDWKTFG